MEKNKLFPDSYASALTVPAGGSLNKGRLMFMAASIAGSTLLLLVLFLIYRFSLLSLGDNILKVVNKG